MTPQDQIKALAELDGWTLQEFKTHPAWNIWHKGEDQRSNETLPHYLTSYDAIIPLVQKQDHETRRKIGSCPHGTTGMISIMMTPHQLCEALLKAVGKWKY